jgi:isopentenyldiphosphate isomerase
VELIDILTPDGDPTGARASKHDVHARGHWHRAAHVWIVAPDGRVLLQRRSERKENWPGLWDVSVAGHVSAGESALDAAIREAGEELGLALTAPELTHIGTIREQCVLSGGTYLDNEIHEVFLTRREISLGTLVLDPEEVAEVALADPHALSAWALVPHPDEYALLRATLRNTQKCPGGSGS